MSIQVYARARDTTSCVYHLADNLNNSGSGIGLTLGGDNDSFIYGSSGGKWGNYIQCSGVHASNGKYPCLSSKWNIDPLATDFYLDFWIRCPDRTANNLQHFNGLGFELTNSGEKIRCAGSQESGVQIVYDYTYPNQTTYFPLIGTEVMTHVGFVGLKNPNGALVIVFFNGKACVGRYLDELPAPKFGNYICDNTPGSTPETSEITWRYSQTEFSEIHFTQCLPEIINFSDHTFENIRKWRLPVPSAAYTGSEQWIGWQYLSDRKIYDGTAWQTLKATDKMYLNGAWRELGGCSHVWVPVIDAATGSKRRCTVCGYVCQHPSTFIGTCEVCGFTLIPAEL